MTWNHFSFRSWLLRVKSALGCIGKRSHRIRTHKPFVKNGTAWRPELLSLESRDSITPTVIGAVTGGVAGLVLGSALTRVMEHPDVLSRVDMSLLDQTAGRHERMEAEESLADLPGREVGYLPPQFVGWDSRAANFEQTGV